MKKQWHKDPVMGHIHRLTKGDVQVGAVVKAQQGWAIYKNHAGKLELFASADTLEEAKETLKKEVGL